MRKEAYYFSHDSNARNDNKILELRAELGWEGYGLYWAIIEILRDSSDYTYSSNTKTGLALSLGIDKPKLEQLLGICIQLGLLVEEDGSFYSESLMRRMELSNEKRRKRAEAGRLGGEAKAKAKQKDSNAKAKGSKGKEKKGKESKELIVQQELANLDEDGNKKWNSFQTWFAEQRFEYVIKIGEQITPAQLMKLIDKGGAGAIKEKLTHIENSKNKYTGYKSVYLTINNWLNKETK
jgi:hypothetical protein